MNEIQKIKADIWALRIIVYAICIYIGFSLGQSCSDKNANTNQDKSLNHLLDNPADRGADKSPATADSITAFLYNGAVHQSC